MGRKTKKFIDKKKYATFQLLSRDSADHNFAADAPGGDRIFARVDDNPFTVETFGKTRQRTSRVTRKCPALVACPGRPLEKSSSCRKTCEGRFWSWGFADDGYNYLVHLREIRNTGGGSAVYQNHKARLDLVPKNVKAYDASKAMVSGVNDEPNNGSIYKVAFHLVNVRIQKVLDPEVAALLDDSDMSRFGSDVEDLEEDFVAQANCPDQGEHVVDRALNSLRISETTCRSF